MGIQAIRPPSPCTPISLFQCLIRRDGYSSQGRWSAWRDLRLFQCLIRRDGYSSTKTFNGMLSVIGFNASFGVMGIQAASGLAFHSQPGCFNASFGVMGIQAGGVKPMLGPFRKFQCLIRRDGYSSHSTRLGPYTIQTFQCLIRRDGYSSSLCLRPGLAMRLFQCLIRRDGYSSECHDYGSRKRPDVSMPHSA